ncbi:MAG TPA: TonB family protein [Terriglobales bacterium]|nr:TonB family protein [Terriglobales bacterium]
MKSIVTALCCCFFVLLFPLFLVAENGGAATEIQVTPEEAQQHLTKRVAPIYPNLAELARIQGLIRLLITIDTAGKTKSIQVISGHPMLIDAALNAARQWQYEPFEADGQPIEVKTEIAIAVPDSGRHDEVKHKDPVLRTYLQAKREGEQALMKNDFETAHKKLLTAQSAIESRRDTMWQGAAATSAELATAAFGQKNDEEAKKSYKDALALYEAHQFGDKVEAAGVMELLARIYLSENDGPAAEPLLLRAVDIYKKNLTPDMKSDARSWYERHLAMSSFWLLSIAKSSHNSELAKTRCKDVVDNMKALSAEQQSYVQKDCGEAK